MSRSGVQISSSAPLTFLQTQYGTPSIYAVTYTRRPSFSGKPFVVDTQWCGYNLLLQNIHPIHYIKLNPHSL